MVSINRLEFSCLVEVDRILSTQEKQTFYFSAFSAFSFPINSNLEKNWSNN